MKLESWQRTWMGKIHTMLKFIHSDLLDQVVHKGRQTPMLGPLCPNYRLWFKKSLRTDQDNGHTKSEQRYTLLFPSPLHLLFLDICPQVLLETILKETPNLQEFVAHRFLWIFLMSLCLICLMPVFFFPSIIFSSSSTFCCNVGNKKKYYFA